jgi:hypothetical protein
VLLEWKAFVTTGAFRNGFGVEKGYCCEILASGTQREVEETHLTKWSRQWLLQASGRTPGDGWMRENAMPENAVTDIYGVYGDAADTHLPISYCF